MNKLDNVISSTATGCGYVLFIACAILVAVFVVILFAIAVAGC